MNNNWIKQEGSCLIIDGRLVCIPNYNVIGELGGGANAKVFRACDKNLNREVAIKIWNERGRARAQEESIKIASFKHPLVVETYSFNTIDGYPYAVMELVSGQSGKKWMVTRPSLEDKIAIWQLYSKALMAIYSKGASHGDPHLGNVLILKDHDGIISLKLADAGTSNFRGDKEKLLERESNILYETARKLFSEFDLLKLWGHPCHISHTQCLNVLNRLVAFIEILNDKTAYDRKAHSAKKIVDIVFDAPFFNLEEMDRLIDENISIGDRFKLYLNRKLLNVAENEIKDEYYDLFPAAMKKYDGWKLERLKSLKLGAE